MPEEPGPFQPNRCCGVAAPGGPGTPGARDSTGDPAATECLLGSTSPGPAPEWASRARYEALAAVQAEAVGVPLGEHPERAQRIVG